MEVVQAEPPIIRAMDFRNKSILVVEDERIIREIVVRMLNVLGVGEIVDVSSAESAWEHLLSGKKHFHAVITDLSLPGASGGCLIKNLRSLPSPRAKTLPIIVLTGSSDLATYKRVEGNGISSYLIKPISVDLLRASLEKAMAAPTRP